MKIRPSTPLSMLRFITKWVIIAALSLAMCEVSLRVWGFSPIYAIQIKGLPAGQSDLLFSLDKDRLYRMKPWAESHINRAGFRDIEFTSPSPDRFRIVVIGDSFPMGLAVLPDETFPKQLQRTLGPGFEVLNLGIQGYGPDQELDVIQKEVLSLNPKLVIWSFFPGNDFADVVKNSLYVPSSDGVLTKASENYVTRNTPHFKLQLVVNLARYGNFLSPNEGREIDEAFFQDRVKILVDLEDPYRKFGVPMTRSIVAAGKKVLTAHNIALGAVIIPSFEIIQDDSRLAGSNVPKSAYTTNEDLMSEMLSTLDIPYVNLTPMFQQRVQDGLYYIPDRHLSVRGNALAADLIAAMLRSRGLTPPTNPPR